jgi:hypothetical protein
MYPSLPSMARRLVIGGVVLLMAVLLLVVAGVAMLTLGVPDPAAAPPAATLTVYVGTARVQRAGAAAAVAAHSGEAVASGDKVSTGPNSKAGLTYADGSVTRLDSQAAVVVHVARSGGGLQVSLQQTAGLTWNQVLKLAGRSSFQVAGPNNAVAGVRGTRFGFYIEQDAAGQPVVWIDTYEGIVHVTSGVGAPVDAVANQRVTVRAGAAPTRPGPIPATDLQLSFTVFNQTIEAVAGVPVAFASGALSTGQSAGPFTVQADGRSDLEFVLGWPGSIYQLTVMDPNGKVFTQPASTTPPISARVPKAMAGTWTFTVHDIRSPAFEAWWVIVGRK